MPSQKPPEFTNTELQVIYEHLIGLRQYSDLSAQSSSHGVQSILDKIKCLSSATVKIEDHFHAISDYLCVEDYVDCGACNGDNDHFDDFGPWFVKHPISNKLVAACRACWDKTSPHFAGDR